MPFSNITGFLGADELPHEEYRFSYAENYADAGHLGVNESNTLNEPLQRYAPETTPGLYSYVDNNTYAGFHGANVPNTLGGLPHQEYYIAYAPQTILSPVNYANSYINQRDLVPQEAWGQYQQPAPIIPASLDYVGGYFEPLNTVVAPPEVSNSLGDEVALQKPAPQESPNTINNSYTYEGDAEPSETGGCKPQTSLPVADTAPLSLKAIGRKGKKLQPSDYNCGTICNGGFLGEHQCTRQDDVLGVKCKYASWDCKRLCFKTKGGFNRHYNSEHLKDELREANMVDCPFKGCNRIGKRGFSRHDNMLQHRRRTHKENIPKVHVWPGKKSNRPKSAQPNGAGPSDESK